MQAKVAGATATFNVPEVVVPFPPAPVAVNVNGYGEPDASAEVVVAWSSHSRMYSSVAFDPDVPWVHDPGAVPVV